MAPAPPRRLLLAWAGLVVALVALGALTFGGFLSYYGDVDPREYRWKGPAGAVLIVTACVGAAVALQPLPGWLRGLGYVALTPFTSFLTFAAAVTYDEERCDDPANADQCGIPTATGMLWGAAATVGVIVLIVVAEILRARGDRGLTK